jgi:hypothetical protein
MIRSVVIAVALIGLTAHAASAQQLTYKGLPLRQAFSASVVLQTAPAPAPPAVSFAHPRLSVAPRSTASQSASSQSKSFWHTPWPYVIAGAATAAIIVIAHHGSSTSTSGGGY